MNLVLCKKFKMFYVFFEEDLSRRWHLLSLELNNHIIKLCMLIFAVLVARRA